MHPCCDIPNYCETPAHRMKVGYANFRPKLVTTAISNILQHKINPNKLKPGLVASYDLRPGNGMGLFWKEQIDKSRNKQVKKHLSKEDSIRREESKEGRKEGTKLSKHTNKQFIQC